MANNEQKKHFFKIKFKKIFFSACYWLNFIDHQEITSFQYCDQTSQRSMANKKKSIGIKFTKRHFIRVYEASKGIFENKWGILIF